MKTLIDRIIVALGGWTNSQALAYGIANFNDGHKSGVVAGESKCKLKFAVLPLPFTEEQLLARAYGEFITPVNFGVDEFGECNIPAPGVHGYQQRPYYVSKYSLDDRAYSSDLRCHFAGKFQDPSSSDTLVPVIVTVLR